MDAVAFAAPEVINFISKNLIPLRLPADDKTYAVKFHIKWTPSLLLLDVNGSEQSRTLGYFSPRELIPALLLGISKARFSEGEYLQTTANLERIITDFSGSFQAPEAIYLHGVCSFIQSHDVTKLVDIYDRLLLGYPDSEWLMKADPYRLLKSP